MNKKLLAMIFATMLTLSACGDDTSAQGTPEEPATPPDLTGEWIQVNSESDDTYHVATITENTITINWVMPDTKALYWAGTFEAPTSADEPYTWDSQNDTSQTDTALLASGDETKTFTYEDGEITYEASMMGITSTIRMEKQ